MIECPVQGCKTQIKSYRYLGHHTRPKHRICSDCALNRKTVCRCQEERIARQSNRGEIVRIRLAPRTRGHRTIDGELWGDPTKDTFITVAEEGKYQFHLIHKAW